MVYMIGGVTFRTKESIAVHVRAIINPKVIGDKLTGPERDFMIALFKWGHRDWEKKRGAGGKAIRVQQDAWGNKGFVIERIDGTEDGITWLGCIYPSKPGATQKGALRNEIVAQIFSTKDAAFGNQVTIICPVLNITITREQADVHHVTAFELMVPAWCTAANVELASLNLTERNDGFDLLADRVLAKDWQDYHQEHAILQVVSLTANRGVLKRKAHG